MTSARAVSSAKRLLPRKTKVGHTGTLDPLASGLLVLLIGRATRLSRYITSLEKSYTATARFGAVSDTLDADGNLTPLDNAPRPDEDAIRAALPDFEGDLLQTPPMASAVKIGGTRLYDLHRRGISVEREPRAVTVHSLALASFDPAIPAATFRISCSSGTYVRTLIADLAASLNTGAYLTSLRRTRVGHLSLQSATSLTDLTPDSLYNHIIHPSLILSHLSAVEVDAQGEGAVRSGRELSLGEIEGSVRVERRGELLAVYRGDGERLRAEVVLCGV